MHFVCTLQCHKHACKDQNENERMKKLIEKDGKMCRMVLRCAVFCIVSAVTHDDGWGRKWQHKCLLKRGNGGIYKIHVELYSQPMPSWAVVSCVLICETSPVLHAGRAFFTVCHAALKESRKGHLQLALCWSERARFTRCKHEMQSWKSLYCFIV